MSDQRTEAVGEHAVVIGASMAGLLAARALSNAYERVTIIERDVLPPVGESRRAVPQGRHAHVMLASGQRAIEELLPGITDLQRNRLDRGAIVIFSTGAPRPQTTFQGTVMDWRSGRPAPAALIVATLLPDSLPYRGVADSSGSFRLGPLPVGEYIVNGVLDENRNNLADPREAFDSVRVSRGRDSTVELWAFVHDTTPPRIRAVTPVDSMSATVESCRVSPFTQVRRRRSPKRFQSAGSSSTRRGPTGVNVG